MNSPWLPDARETHAIIVEEVTDAGGTVQDCRIDEELLYLRSVFPRISEVLEGDQVQAGMAVRVMGQDVLVHAFTFRQLCKNGVIVATPTQSQSVRRVEFSASDDAIEEAVSELCEALRTCSKPEVFSHVVDRMRSATGVRANTMSDLFPPGSLHLRMLAGAYSLRIAGRFHEGKDRSVFGLMNAVTSVARDEPDPDKRWRLEELGGAILMNVPSAPRPRLVATAALPV